MSNEIVKPNGVITSEQAKTMDRFFNARHEAMSNCIGQSDNRSSWWSLDDLRNFLTYAENQAEQLGYTMNGVRIYNAAHSENGLSTLFIAPTGCENNGNAKMMGSNDIPDCDLFNAGDFGEPPSKNYPQ